MERRSLRFCTYDEAIAEIERLRDSSYEPLGQWNLGRTCWHLSYYMRGSLEGYSFRLPWLVRKLLGRPMLRRVLRSGRLPSGGRTIPASVPGPDIDEPAAIAEAIELLGRLENHTGELHPSPLFGSLTADECRTLHLLHTAHHLGFLVAKGP